ncbi:MAG: HNH endonuclease [Cumulibacter sp.]
MEKREDGTSVPHDDALAAWSDVAYKELKSLAQTYNAVTRYGDLRHVMHDETGIASNQQMRFWIGDVLERVAQRAADAGEPPITALCLRGNGTIGEGYGRAPRYSLASRAQDIEVRAAEDRLLCYRQYATDLPPGGGVPTLTPEVQIQRRKEASSDWMDTLIQGGALTVRDHVPFQTHVQVARLFGRTYRGHQSATIRLDEFTEVWFPKMYSNADWNNTLSANGQTIVMRHVEGGDYGDVMTDGQMRNYVITFGHVKPSSGPAYYEFLGVFEGAPHLSDATTWTHQRVSDTITFDGNGGYSYVPVRSRPLQDDQSAEASDSDPGLVAEYQEALEAGRYTVEDAVGTSKSRGSAQQVFAKAVKDNYGWECAVTGISTRAFLVASHIVPWAEDKTLRLDPSNGICLSTFVDRAFDAGFLTITPEGRTSVRWEKVVDDFILRSELSRIDDVELREASATPPDPEKLRRRMDLIP